MYRFQKLENMDILNVNFQHQIFLLVRVVKNYVLLLILLMFLLLLKKDWMIQGLQDETYVLLMDDDGEMREDLQVPYPL